jgi:murein L,D-transpeptidase YcbB/YkuD
MSEAWREAKSLQTLEGELQEYYPGTTTWEIGDKAHQATRSDHNKNAKNVVCAKDILGDGNPALDLQDFVDFLRANPHPNLRYIIFNRKIYQRKNDWEPQDYNGINAHKTHVHLSVGNGPDGRSTSGYDSTASWNIADFAAGKKPSKPTTPSKPSTGTGKLGDKMPTVKRGAKGATVRRLQALLTAAGYKTSIDGIFGSQTERQLRAFQNKHAKPVDGIAGPITWNALLGL